MSEIRSEIEGIIKINVDYVSNKDGINREDCDKLPEALGQQLEQWYLSKNTRKEISLDGLSKFLQQDRRIEKDNIIFKIDGLCAIPASELAKAIKAHLESRER